MIARSTKSRAPRPDELGPLVARCRRLLWTAAHSELAARGDSMWAWQMLTHVGRSGAISQCDLAYATAHHPAGVSRLLAELETAGLVRRRRDRVDRRRMLVELTRKGRERQDALAVHVYGAIGRTLTVLSQPEQADLHRLLSKLAGDDEAAQPPGPAPRARHSRSRRPTTLHP
jgi:DNA-binding MarR family transcriptional regulator